MTAASGDGRRFVSGIQQADVVTARPSDLVHCDSQRPGQ